MIPKFFIVEEIRAFWPNSQSEGRISRSRDVFKPRPHSDVISLWILSSEFDLRISILGTQIRRISNLVLIFEYSLNTSIKASPEVCFYVWRWMCYMGFLFPIPLQISFRLDTIPSCPRGAYYECSLTTPTITSTQVCFYVSRWIF